MLGLAQSLFGAAPTGYALGLRGYDFNEFGERLSGRARSNLAEAVRTFRSVIAERRFRAAERRFSRAAAEAGHRVGEGA